MCRDEQLATHSLSHVPSQMALGSQPPTLHFFYMWFVPIFLAYYKHSKKISKHIHTWWWLPSSWLLACNSTREPNHKTSTWGRQGWTAGKGTDVKTQAGDFTGNLKDGPSQPVAEGHSPQSRSFTRHPYSWTPQQCQWCDFWTRGPQNECEQVHRQDPPTVWIWLKTDATNLHCLTVKLMLRKKLTLRFIFATF